MEIHKKNQYNQAIGKYKVLSSTAGVGSLITTKWGGFIMPLSTDNWKFISVISNRIKSILPAPIDPKKLQEETGIEVINDPRFVDFLVSKKAFSNLKCFVAVPHIQLDSYNRIQRAGNPHYEAIKEKLGTEMTEDLFYVPAINFPKWFTSSNQELKTLSEWEKVWKDRRCNDGNLLYFVPPRDPYKKTYRKLYENLTDQTVYGLLKPVPLVLICPNGHISDIPWYKFFCASINKENLSDDKGFDLFSYQCDDCSKGGKHNIKWLISRNQSESWGTLKCSKCEKSITLSGIMNIKPKCRGERPWDKEDSYDRCRNNNNEPVLMQVAMVTSNSIYYSSGFSSLYIPEEFIPKKDGQLSTLARKALEKVNVKYNQALSKRPNTTKEDFWNQKYNICDDFIEDASIDWNIDGLTPDDYKDIKNVFLELIVEEEDRDPVNTYRLTEYEVFTDSLNPSRRAPGLEFNEIDMPDTLRPYFTSIKQVNTLSLTSTQLGFGRVSMPTSKIDNGKVVPPGDEMKSIFSGTKEDVYVLPANQTYGEGLFFAFDNTKVEEWGNKLTFEDRYKTVLESGSLGSFLNSEISMYGRAKFYLLHTFSHILMKELEFSCGYPTASLNERLYYSDKMCGVLIYTADGAEGSMGGLVWQGQRDLIQKIIKSALQRAQNCSSDPLCWENEDGLNRASCFCCTMVSETSCEQANLGLDRRALVDPQFGYFKDLV